MRRSSRSRIKAAAPKPADAPLAGFYCCNGAAAAFAIVCESAARRRQQRGRLSVVFFFSFVSPAFSVASTLLTAAPSLDNDLKDLRRRRQQRLAGQQRSLVGQRARSTYDEEDLPPLYLARDGPLTA